MTLNQREICFKLLLATRAHIGAQNCDFLMERYSFKRKKNGTHIIDIHKTWEKLHLAARVIITIKNANEIHVQSCRQDDKYAVSRFCHYIGARTIFEKHCPGSFTNQTHKNFREPRILIVKNPRVEHQTLKETKFIGVPVIAFCDTDSSLKNVDIAIPSNHKAKHAIGVLYYQLAYLVMQMRGSVQYGSQWNVTPDEFIVEDEIPDLENAHTIDKSPLPCDYLTHLSLNNSLKHILTEDHDYHFSVLEEDYTFNFSERDSSNQHCLTFPMIDYTYTHLLKPRA